MRVISRATDSIEKEVTCDNCGAYLGYMPCDIIQQDTYTMFVGPGILRYFSCPECSYKIILSNKKRKK